MSLSLKKINHLIRYFIPIGIIVFIGYLQHWRDDFFLIFIGPALYLAYHFKNLILSFISFPQSAVISQFGFVLPFCIFYYGFLGFQLKQLWNERGKTRFFSLLALTAFLIYIHYAAWINLSGFFAGPPPAELPPDLLHQRPVINGALGNNEGQTLRR